MPEMGLLRGMITLVTLLTFLGICWWAYRPENRTRFEEDGMLAFGEDDLQQIAKDRSMKIASNDENTERNAEESQA